MIAVPELGEDPGRGDPEAVRDMARLFGSRADAAGRCSRRVSHAVRALSSASSEAIDAARPGIVLLQDRFGHIDESTRVVERILYDYASGVEEIRRRTRTVSVDAAEAWRRLCDARAAALDAAPESTAGWAGGWSDVFPSAMYSEDHGALRRWQCAIDEFTCARDGHLSLVEERAELDRRTQERLSRVPLYGVLAGEDAGGRAAVRTVQAWAADMQSLAPETLAAIGEPGLVRQVWDALTRERQHELLASAPVLLGRLAGLPPWARVLANRMNAKARIAVIRLRLALTQSPIVTVLPPSYPTPRTDTATKLLAELAYLEEVAAGRVQLYDYDHSTDSIVEMIGEIGPGTTDINTYVPGTFTSALAVYRGEVQQVARWLGRNSNGSSVTFVWKGDKFPGEDAYEGTADLLRIYEANDEELALRKGREIEAFQRGLLAATRGTGADYNAIGFSWGLAGIAAAEVAGARFHTIVSLAGAGMPGSWEPQPDTRYEHFSYRDALGAAQGLGLVWNSRNPGDDPAFTSHVYEHEGDFTMLLPTGIPPTGLGNSGGEVVELQLNSDPIDAHNLIASNDPANQRILDDVKAALQ